MPKRIVTSVAGKSDPRVDSIAMTAAEDTCAIDTSASYGGANFGGSAVVAPLMGVFFNDAAKTWDAEIISHANGAAKRSGIAVGQELQSTIGQFNDKD